MKDSSNDRVIDLLKNLEIGEMDLARMIGKQPTTVYRITKKEVIPSRATLQLISNAAKCNFEWLLTGQGEMFDHAGGTAGFGTGLSKALELLKEQLNKKDEQIQNLLTILSKVNFHKLLPETDSAKIIYLFKTEQVEEAAKTA
jgi:transcriptional regulator with XRE-family HTH domain